MKITLVLLLIAGSQITYAQCDKTVNLKATKTSYLNDKGEVDRTQDQKASITISKTEVIIVVDDDHKMTGQVSSAKCEWKTPFKDGKSVIKATMSDADNNEQHATLTITGVEGKVTLTYEAEERPGIKIQVVADSFAEIKP
jgi:hypothetical protein